MTTRYFTIVNPAAGGGRCGRQAPAALERLGRMGFDLEVHYTERTGQATELARRALEEGHRRFLAVGGDGTSYEIVNGLFSPRPHSRLAEPERPILAMLPLGTGNSFLRDFAITDAGGALRALERNESRACDVVRATHECGVIHYINLLSVGFSAKVGELTNRRFKHLGPAGYAAAVVITAARLTHPSFGIRLDDGQEDERPCVLLSFSNSRYTGGRMMIAPHADPGDGVLDVIRVGPMKRLHLVRSFPAIFKGEHIHRPEVEVTRASRVELDLPRPVDVMVDGEVQRLKLERLEVLPRALLVVA